MPAATEPAMPATSNPLGVRPDQAAMDVYLREGEARAAALGNRGPVRN